MLRGAGMMLYRGVRFFLSGIFLWSGVIKMMDVVPFGILINAFGLIPHTWALPAAFLISAVEIIAGTGLVFDIRGSLAIISGLLMVFIAILLYGIHMGLDIDCGCFGVQDPEYRAFHGLHTALYRDLVMAVGIIYLYTCRHFRSIRPERFDMTFNRFFTHKEIYFE